ncbi:MAG TPA: KTSC domain-containing protein [Mycobacteriales bacterium]|nr:KTSC domain-containing protein [Mycobacteriales bacterium]
MILHPVISENVRAVGYDPRGRILRVAFLSGGTYDYYGVASSLYEQMLLPNPWRRVGRLVRSHAYLRVA